MNVCSFDVDIRILQRKRTSRVCGERGGRERWRFKELASVVPEAGTSEI